MRRESMVTDKWWMIFRPFTPEPYALWRFYILLMGVTLLLLLAGALSAYFVHGSWTKEPGIDCTTDDCRKQGAYWSSFLKKDVETKEAAAKRIEHLKSARSNPDDKIFTQSWSWFESELAQLERIMKPKYRIHSILESFLPLMVFVFGSLLIYLSISRLVLLHSNSVFMSAPISRTTQEMIGNWKTPLIQFAFVLAAPMIISELCTSVFAETKTWFGYDSFCVTPSTFVLKCIAYLTFGCVAATPFTVLWCLSRRDNIPRADPSAGDGKFGAERYVEFVQTGLCGLFWSPLLWAFSS
jgi:hypothetical protein